ncbi:MAG: ABC transporter permease subunit [Phycisphaerales bacterium]|jgi:ABC-type transport system involved in multi-copper enzyme maturation permease subunit|nr:ABC transporter permease subunit [Phycisphaerales bacterium]
MLLQTATIARNTFVESIRQPFYPIVIALSGILQLFNTWSAAFSMGWTETGEFSGDNKLLLDIGLSTVFVLGMLLAAFVATAVLSREIERKTVLTVVSKPISRAAVVLGKFLGAAGSIVWATLLMVLFLMMGLRHGVMSTAADTLDMPVILFSLTAIGLSLAVGIAGNFFYGWSFPQTVSILLLPLMLVAYALVLALSKKWAWQSLATDFKPQAMLACLSMLLAILVLTAVATAASTRLGQVMTIVVCAGVFMVGLLSNYFIGRSALENTPVARVGAAEPLDPSRPDLTQRGTSYVIGFDQPALTTLQPGMSFYFGPAANGSALAVPAFPPIDPPRYDADAALAAGQPSRLVMTETHEQGLIIRNIGEQPLRVQRPPERGDFIFLRPTRVNAPAYAAWAIIPNMQAFWLLDAVSQNSPIPPSHVGLLAIYALLQIGAFLALAVALFQTRDVG